VSRARFLESERRVGFLCLAPALLAVAAFSLAPLAIVLWLSLRRHMPVFGISRFVGLDNYAYLVSDPRFLSSLGNTAYVVLASVALELVLGLLVALLLDRSFSGRRIARAAVLVPWAFPTVVAASAWGFLLSPGFGVVNRVLGIDANWLGDPWLAIHAVILADVWKSTPLAALLLLAGLQVIPRDLGRAALVDGAGAAARFFRVTLPLLRPTILVVVLFRSLDAFRIFDVVYVLTGGGPANTTESVSLYAYRLYFQTLQFGTGSAVSIASCLVMAAWSAVMVGLLSTSRRGA